MYEYPMDLKLDLREHYLGASIDCFRPEAHMIIRIRDIADYRRCFEVDLPASVLREETVNVLKSFLRTKDQSQSSLQRWRFFQEPCHGRSRLLRRWKAWTACLCGF